MYGHVRSTLLTCSGACAPIVGAALFAASTANAGGSEFESGPYLSQLSARSVVVRVETESAEEVTLTAEPGKLRVIDDKAKTGVHSLGFDALSPSTTYHYAVQSNRGAREEGTFTTAPADDDTKNVRFTLYGDDRSGTTIHQAIVKLMLDEPADFLVHTGDLVADGRIAAQWEGFFDVEDKLLRERCLFTAIGNHDVLEENGAAFLRYFGTAEQQQKHVLYTSFRWSFLRFFVINGEGTFLGEDRVWLERELQKADTEPGIVWRIVVVHDGPFASGLHGDNDRLHGAQLPQLFRDHHVDFVLEGHDHIYERGTSDGMRYVVSGGAGAPLYPIRHRRVTARKIESVYHYVLFDFGRDKGRMTAKRVDGATLEEIGFSKSNMWDDDIVQKLPGVATTDAPDGSAPAAPADVPPRSASNGSPVPYIVGLLAAAAGIWFWMSRRKRS